MKFFVAFVALVAVALASPTNLHKPTFDHDAQLEAIIAAINSPNTDPATAALLQQQLQDIINSVAHPEPIAVGPTLIDDYEPVVVGPAIVAPVDPEGIAVGPAIVDEYEPVAVGPTLVDESIVAGAVSGSNGNILVQIIVNVNQASVAPGVVDTPVFETPAHLPDIVDQSPDSVNIVDQAPESVNVIEEAPETVVVVDQVQEGVNVVQPIMPTPVINLPESLN